MIAQAVKWIDDIDGYLELVDQRKLPIEFITLQCRDVDTLFDAIKTLAVRGAPAIGVSAAYGIVLALQKPNDQIEKAMEILNEAHAYLASSRPTAVNLFWALDRMQKKAAEVSRASLPRIKGGTPSPLKAFREAILAEAIAIHQEDIEMCRRIGQNGQKFIEEGTGILTHCNAGALATGGQGTALSLMFEAQKNGKAFRVFADETRPLLQGARLTAWELMQAGIDVTVICDNMAGWLMKQGKINAIITGADRIAANGDTANKIGTYSLSILAREHGVPFYIAAPSSTFDLSIKSGTEIPIEQRSAEEVISFRDAQAAPTGVGVYNPAFDVTEARDIAAIITERGVIETPNTERVSEHLA